MRIDLNLLIAAQIIHDECDKNICCNNCQLCDICYDKCPNDWDIPNPPPERQRIEWLRMLPDKNLINSLDNAGFHRMPWWHEIVTLEQFRKDVGIDG